MTQLTILVILIILVGVGLFVLISKVASTPDEPVEEAEEEDLFQEKSELEESTDLQNGTHSEKGVREETVSRWGVLYQSVRTFGIKVVEKGSQGSRATARIIIHFTKGGVRYMKGMKQNIGQTLESGENHEEHSELEETEQQNAEEYTESESPTFPEEDTQFLEKPSPKKSFSTFDENLEAEEEESTGSSEQRHTQHSQDRNEPQKVTSFIESMFTDESRENREEGYQSGASSSYTYHDFSDQESKETTPAQEEKEGNDLFEKGQDHLERLEQKYLQMIVNDPKNIDSYRKLGNLYMAMEQYTDARETFAHILRLREDDQRAREKLQEVDRILK